MEKSTGRPTITGKIGKNSQLRVSLPLAQFSKITVVSSGQTFDAAT